MFPREQVERVPCRDDGYLGALRHGAQGRRGTSHAHAMARENERALGGGNHGAQFADGRRRRVLNRRHPPDECRGINHRGLDIEWHVKPDRARPAGEHFMQRAIDVIADAVGRLDHGRVLRHRRDHRHDVHFLHAALAQRTAREPVRALHLP